MVSVTSLRVPRASQTHGVRKKKKQLTKNDLLVSSRYTYEVWLMAAKDLKNLQDKQTEVRARC